MLASVSCLLSLHESTPALVDVGWYWGVALPYTTWYVGHCRHVGNPLQKSFGDCSLWLCANSMFGNELGVCSESVLHTVPLLASLGYVATAAAQTNQFDWTHNFYSLMANPFILELMGSRTLLFPTRGNPKPRVSWLVAAWSPQHTSVQFGRAYTPIKRRRAPDAAAG